MQLQQRLADEYRAYMDARVQAARYADQVLPRAEETLQLVGAGFRLGEIGYLELPTAQRTFSQTNLAYLESVSQFWTSRLAIEGLLLSDSLTQPL